MFVKWEFRISGNSKRIKRNLQSKARKILGLEFCLKTWHRPIYFSGILTVDVPVVFLKASPDLSLSFSFSFLFNNWGANFDLSLEPNRLKTLVTLSELWTSSALRSYALKGSLKNDGWEWIMVHPISNMLKCYYSCLFWKSKRDWFMNSLSIYC